MTAATSTEFVPFFPRERGVQASFPGMSVGRRRHGLGSLLRSSQSEPGLNGAGTQARRSEVWEKIKLYCIASDPLRHGVDPRAADVVLDINFMNGEDPLQVAFT